MLDTNSGEAEGRMQQVLLPVLMTPLGELELINAAQLRLFRKEVRPLKLRLRGLRLMRTLSAGCSRCARCRVRRSLKRCGSRHAGPQALVLAASISFTSPRLSFYGPMDF